MSLNGVVFICGKYVKAQHNIDVNYIHIGLYNIIFICNRTYTYYRGERPLIMHSFAYDLTVSCKRSSEI